MHRQTRHRPARYTKLSTAVHQRKSWHRASSAELIPRTPTSGISVRVDSRRQHAGGFFEQRARLTARQSGRACAFFQAGASSVVLVANDRCDICVICTSATSAISALGPRSGAILKRKTGVLPAHLHHTRPEGRPSASLALQSRSFSVLGDDNIDRGRIHVIAGAVHHAGRNRRAVVLALVGSPRWSPTGTPAPRRARRVQIACMPFRC